MVSRDLPYALLLLCSALLGAARCCWKKERRKRKALRCQFCCWTRLNSSRVADMFKLLQECCVCARFLLA